METRKRKKAGDGDAGKESLCMRRTRRNGTKRKMEDGDCKLFYREEDKREAKEEDRVLCKEKLNGGVVRVKRTNDSDKH